MPGGTKGRKTRRQADNAEAAMPLREHLGELRSRLVKSLLAISVGMAVAWFFYDEIFAVIRAPFDDVVAETEAQGREMTLAFTGVADPFVMQLKVAGVTGILLASPVWLYQLWRFVTPGLHRNERRWALGFAVVATPMFLAGAVLAYWVMPRGPADPARLHPGEHREHHLRRPLPLVLPADDAGLRPRVHAAAARGAASTSPGCSPRSACGRGGGGSCWGSWCSRPSPPPPVTRSTWRCWPCRCSC